MGKHSARHVAAAGKHAAPGRSFSVSGNRGLLAAGTAAGVAAVFGANLVSSAFGDNSAPIPPGANLENIDVSVSSGHTVYARNASMSLVTSSDQSLVSIGSTVTFTYVLKNTGQTDFTNVRISDVGCSQIVGPTGNDADPLLNIGETWTYTCSTVLLADTTSVATVTATPTLTSAAPRPSASSAVPSASVSPSASPTASAVASSSASPSTTPTSNTQVVNYVTIVNGIPVSVDPRMSPSVILAPGQTGGFACATITNNTNGYQVWYDNGACFDGSALLLWETPGATVISATPVATPTPAPTPTPTVVTPTPTPTSTAPARTVVDGVYTGTSTVVDVPGQGITGNVQVVATITGGKISAITVPVCPSVDRTSKSLCAAATPTLISEAIAANSANIASYSGATYTSAAFKTSLQSALTMAGY